MDTEFKTVTHLKNGVTLCTSNEVEYDVYITEFWNMHMLRPRIICRSYTSDDAKNNHYSILELLNLTAEEE